MKFNKKAIAAVDKSGDNQTGTNISKTVIKLLRYKKITNENYLELTDSTFAEMLQVEGIGLQTLSNTEISQTLNQYLNFLRRYLDDVIYITALYPVETEKQRQFWIRKYKKTNNPQRKKYIDDKIRILEETHKQKANQEYMLICFGKTIEELNENISKIKSWGGNAIKTHPISREKKISKLYQLNNMTANSKE